MVSNRLANIDKELKNFDVDSFSSLYEVVSSFDLDYDLKGYSVIDIYSVLVEDAMLKYLLGSSNKREYQFVYDMVSSGSDFLTLLSTNPDMLRTFYSDFINDRYLDINEDLIKSLDYEKLGKKNISFFEELDRVTLKIKRRYSKDKDFKKISRG